MVNTRNLEEVYLASVYRQLLEKQEEYQQLLQETSAYGRDSYKRCLKIFGSILKVI